MSKQNNIQLVQQIFQAFGESNIDFLLSTLTEDVEWYVAGAKEHIPLAGTYKGREQVAQVFQSVGEFLHLEQFQPQELVAEGDRLVVFGYARGYIRSTNVPVEYDWVHLYTFRQGKISQFREYLDTAAIAATYQSQIMSA